MLRPIVTDKLKRLRGTMKIIDKSYSYEKYDTCDFLDPPLFRLFNLENSNGR